MSTASFWQAHGLQVGVVHVGVSAGYERTKGWEGVSCVSGADILVVIRGGDLG